MPDPGRKSRGRAGNKNFFVLESPRIKNTNILITFLKINKKVLPGSQNCTAIESLQGEGSLSSGNFLEGGTWGCIFINKFFKTPLCASTPPPRQKIKLRAPPLIYVPSQGFKGPCNFTPTHRSAKGDTNLWVWRPLSYLTTTSFTLGSVDKASDLIVLFFNIKFFIFVKMCKIY